jgi:hypothetical protein
MSDTQRAVHRWLGWLFIPVFLGTGLFMRFHEPAMIVLDPVTRILLRSNHIYLLASALLNLVIGSTPALQTSRTAIKVSIMIASLLLLISPPMLLYGFFAESNHGDMERPSTHLGVYSLFAGSLLYGICSIMQRYRDTEKKFSS